MMNTISCISKKTKTNKNYVNESPGTNNISDYSITQDQRHNIKMRKITTVEEIKMSVTG